MDTKNEYRNWNYEKWEEEVKKYGSIAKLAAALEINKSIASKLMNKAKTSPKPIAIEEPNLEEKIREEKRLLKKAMLRDPKIFERVREIGQAAENTEEDLEFLRKVVREELRLEVPKKPQYPKEIQTFLNLLNSNSEDMNMLRAAANEAGKWKLAPKGGF